VINQSRAAVLVCLALVSAALACGSATPSPTPRAAQTANEEPRTFYLGFTPFPSDTTLEAVQYSVEKIAADADLFAQHFDSGVPWPEALSGGPYPQALRDDWEGRRGAVPPGHKVYVAVTPINWDRNGLAPYRGEQEDMPLPVPWNTYTFTQPEVKRAFLNHTINAVEHFQPDFLAIGIEVNLLMKNAPALWPAYLDLHRFVYGELKARYPDLPIFVSLTGHDLLAGYTEADPNAQRRALADILPYTDYFAVSWYPYMTQHLTGPYPNDMYAQLFALGAGKPIAITETGFPAQDLILTQSGLTMPSTPERQADFLSALLAQADERRFEFIVNFVIRDYDPLWEKLGRTDVAAVWRDTGLYDEASQPRPALTVWRDALARPHP
jgi:hypothetical protein